MTAETATLQRTWAHPATVTAWVSSVDHKQIGLRYIVTAFGFFLTGGILAVLMRTQLITAENDFLGPGAYNQVFTMHGTTMIFLFATPILIGLGTYFVPLMMGARDLAFPRLNAFAYWVFLLAGLLLYASFVTGGAPDAGWFAYVPLSNEGFSDGKNMDFWASGIVFLGISTSAGAINFIVSILKFRAPGMGLFRMPLFLWGVIDMAITILIALPYLSLAAVLLLMDRNLGTHFFQPQEGGNPLLWQHLFWLWGHPEVYILLLPALGIISTIVTVFARQTILAYSLVVAASLAIGTLSFGLWVHHMFSTGIDLLPMSFFSAASFTIAIPSGISIFAWLATIWSGRVVIRAPFLWALGFIFTFVIGGISGVMTAVVPFDWQVHDTYFVVAHFHYVLVGGVVFPIMGALHHWFPKMSGRMYHEGLAQVTFWLFFIGFNTTFFVQHYLGLIGMPRRVYTYSEGLGWDVWNLVSSAGAYIIAVAVILMLVNLVRSLLAGPPAGDDPWEGDSLEWATPSPPPPYNFARLPVVHSRAALWGDDASGHAREDESVRTFAIEDELRHGRREAVTTSILDAQPEAVVRLPADSIAPLLVALSLLVASTGPLLDSAVLYAAGIGGALIGAAIWMWPIDDPPPARVELSTGDILTTRVTSARSPGWWGVVLLMVTEAVIFGGFTSSYLMIRGDAPAWPLGGIDPPDLLVPALAIGVLVAGSLVVHWADRGMRFGDVRRARAGLAAGAVLGVVFLAMHASQLLRAEFAHDTNAYGSLYYAITIVHGAHLAAGIGMLLWTIARSRIERFALRPEGSAESPADAEAPGEANVRHVALYWHFVTLAGLLMFAVMYLSVRGL
ncbi:MAG: cytochrome c oxidase subunit I [Dehalococcoidia bacterium]